MDIIISEVDICRWFMHWHVHIDYKCFNSLVKFLSLNYSISMHRSNLTERNTFSILHPKHINETFDRYLKIVFFYYAIDTRNVNIGMCIHLTSTPFRPFRPSCPDSGRTERPRYLTRMITLPLRWFYFVQTNTLIFEIVCNKDWNITGTYRFNFMKILFSFLFINMYLYQYFQNPCLS